MLQEQTVVSDCYILQSRIGEDTCTEYWMATAIFSARRFLLRFLKSEYSDRSIIDELRIRALESYRIRGEMVKDFVEIEDFDGRVFVSSEYYDERQLSEFMASGYTMSLVDVCRAIRMLAQGLLSFHESGILYGNLTPGNIIVEIKGRELASLKIVKPAIACVTLRDTMAFIAPERKKGLNPSQGSDIYSVGILAVLFITGKVPYPENEPKPMYASLRYVTNALFRRGVPENLVRIILAMLLPDVSKRYSSCSVLLRDLQQFMFFPEMKIINTGLDTQRIAIAKPAFKAFDTTDYFNSLSGEKINESIVNKRVYPVRVISELADAESVEVEELLVLSEEKNWTIDDYIAFGKKTVLGSQEQLVPEILESAAAENAVTDIESVASDSGVAAQQFISKTASDQHSILKPVSETDESPALISFPELPAKETSLPASPLAPHIDESRIGGLNQVMVGVGDETKKCTWAYHRILPTDIYDIVARSAWLAGKGTGSFRFIQEPEGGYSNTSLYHSLERLGEKNLYINIGSCARYGTATVEDFMTMLRKSLASVLSRESKAVLQRLAKKISQADASAFFRMPPLGKILFGADYIEQSGGIAVDDRLIQSIADTVCIFARKKKPLVIVVRGGERISRELQGFFTVLSKTVHDKSVCVVIFFDHIQFESWHTLSILSSTRRFDNV